MSNYTAKRLDAGQMARAQREAAQTVIADKSDVYALGAEYLRKAQALDPEIDRVTMKDLGPIGDLMLELENTMGAFQPGEVFNAEPTWLDELIEKIGFLRQWFGPLARIIRQYNTHSQVVKSINEKIGDELNTMVADASVKDSLCDTYQVFEIDLLVTAEVAEIRTAALDQEYKQLKKNKNRTASEDQRLSELEDLMDLLKQRGQNLKVAAGSANETWIGLAGSSKAQSSLIEKLSFSKWFNEAAFKMAARAAVSALRMMRAAQVLERHQAFTEAMMLTASQLQEKAGKTGLDVGTKAVISIALLEKINQEHITGIQERRQILTDWKATLEETDSRLLSMRDNLQAALTADLNAE